jgi:hypothetical protein
MRPGLLLAAVAVAVAGLSAGCAVRPPAPVTTYRVELDPTTAAQGIHYPDAHVIAIAPRVLEERTLARTVMAHEVGHALGCVHDPRQGTIMYPAHGLGEAPIDAPTAREVGQARQSIGRRIVLRTPPVLLASAWWARDLWNRALGAPVVVVEASNGFLLTSRKSCTVNRTSCGD